MNKQKKKGFTSDTLKETAVMTIAVGIIAAAVYFFLIPSQTSCESVIAKVKDAGYKNVILRPLMVVAGDHANNDMAGDDNDSWKSQFEASKNFDSVKTQIAGLGEIDAIQQLYVAHTKAAMDAQ